jgi:hypothetical protein
VSFVSHLLVSVRGQLYAHVVMELMVIAVNFSCGCLCFVSLVSMNSSLTIFNWNVRGLNSVVRREEVLKLLQSSRPMIVCLQETKLEQISDQLVVEFLGQRLSNLFFFLLWA